MYRKTLYLTHIIIIIKDIQIHTQYPHQHKHQK